VSIVLSEFLLLDRRMHLLGMRFPEIAEDV